MAKLEFNLQKMKDCKSELLSISSELDDEQRWLTSFARTMDHTQRSIKNIRDYVYLINVGKSGNQFSAMSSALDECINLYEDNEQYVSNTVDGLKEKPINIVQSSVDLYDEKYSAIKAIDDLNKISEILGLNITDLDLGDTALGAILEDVEYFTDAYTITTLFMQGDIEGALGELWGNVESDIPKWVIAAFAATDMVSTTEGMLYLNFGKSIGENFLEHYELLFSKQSGNFLKDLTEFTWGMTGEVLYDFAINTGYDIVEKGAALFGIDYSEVMEDLTGKAGIEGANLMLSKATNFLCDGVVKATQDVGSQIGDFFSDMGKEIGGLFSW